jgi:ribonucleoside-diphosphate reductase alpha chain
MTQPKTTKTNELHDLGYKIFLDRYAQKDMTRETLAVGDIVIVVVNPQTGQREIGTVTAMDLPKVTVLLKDGETVERDLEHVDKPLETEPGQMMDRVARGIAAIEKDEVTRQKWTNEFRWLLDDWKFVPGGRILTGAGTDQELTYYNCMPPEQEILTSEGYKPIGDVRVGDLVVTHKNRLRKVLHKFERETEEPLYIIKPKKLGYDSMRVTGKHKILAIRSEWVNKHRSRDGIVLQQEPQWIPAQELKLGDYVAAAYDGERRPVETIRISDYIGIDALQDEESVYGEGVIVSTYSAYEVQNSKLIRATVFADGKKTTGKRTAPLNNELVLDEDLCFLFGRWLGDGCITHRSGTDIPSGIKIVFALDELTEAEKIAAIVQAKFGIEAAIKLSSTTRWYDLWVNSMSVGEFFKAFLGYYSHSKFIPEVLMRLPDHLTLELLHGLFSADGYISGRYIGMLLANRNLTMQVHQLLLRLGYLFSIKENTHENGRVPAYRLSATGSEADALFEKFFGAKASERGHDLSIDLEYDNLRWVRIDAIELEDYCGIVQDIEVEEDHSFVSAGVVVSNCYVVPSPRDSRGGIMDTLTHMTEIMSRGGGVGINISSLRPRHAYVKGVNGRSSGSVSWGALYSFVTGLIEQGGSRRGALMLILNDWHPDIFDFINSKRQAGQITNANISVGVSDKLMEAIEKDGDWDLVFPDTSEPAYDEAWDGDLDKWAAAGHKVLHYKTIKARELWNAVIESAWASAEPGVWFRERSNKMANSWYFNPLISTNPCGEQPLGAWSVCNLGALNLANFYDDVAHDVDWKKLDRAVRTATRFLDNVIDSTPYFFEENYQMQMSERRVGLGTMGIAELMIYCGVRYGSDESVEFIDKVYKAIAVSAYETSVELAAEKGAFPQFDAEKLLQSGFMQQMPEQVIEGVRKNGLRNVTLLTQAPTGTTGTMVNTSTGIEPFFSWVYYRKSRLGLHEEKVPVVARYFEENPTETELPEYFITAMELAPQEHVKVQGAFQKWIDSAISKTCNVPNEYTVEQVSELYKQMYALGCKGGTIYRDGSRDEQVLMLKGDKRAEDEMDAIKGKQEEKIEKPETVTTPHRVYPRPNILNGTTVRFNTPFGKSYITMNSDEAGNPFEVFITVGKAGSDIQADAEALGRMISLQLRTTAPQNRREMLKLVVEQLQDIGGARPVGFGPNRILSLPDAVGGALMTHYINNEEPPKQLGLPINGGTLAPDKIETKHEEEHHHEEAKGFVSGADMCPDCGTISLIRTEGCRKCLTCGYSEC